MIFVHVLTLNYPLQYGKRLSDIIARQAAAMYTFAVWVISLGMWVYNTQPKGCFWCHVIDTKGAVLLVILLNKFLLFCFILVLVCGRVKAAAEYHEWSNLDLGIGNFIT